MLIMRRNLRSTSGSAQAQALLRTSRVPCCAVLAISTIVASQPLHAQDKLLTSHALGTSGAFEYVGFGSQGLMQLGFDGLDTARVLSVSQYSIPITFAASFRETWKFDATVMYASGTVRYAATGTGSGNERLATLAGVSDVRMRVSGAVVGDALYVTAGVNLPTGRTSLTSAEFSALRIIAAPSLGIANASVGAGASGTFGLIYAVSAGAWNVAAGASYEHRGSFQPVAAFSAGAPSADFRPGAVVRTSVSADRLLGEHRLAVAFTTDQFSNDRLTGVTTGTESSQVGGEIATVKLGPVYSAEAQFELSTSTFRELLAFASYRWRSPYVRDGTRVDGSSGQYLEFGARGNLDIRRGVSLLLGGDSRVHSGLGVDQGLPTYGVASAAVMGAIEIRNGQFSTQPYVRLQAGSLKQRNARLVDSGEQSFRGVGVGFTVVARF